MSGTTDVLHVVVGVVKNDQQKILIAKRPLHVHQGGLWEFPGGKLEVDESPIQALHRELYEELCIEITSFTSIGKVQHDYPDKSVLLDVYLVDSYKGNAHGREGQEIRWIDSEQLRDFEFPAANLEIIKMLELPDRCLITGSFDTDDDFIEKLTASLQRGIRLIQLRLKNVDKLRQLELAKQAFKLCQKYQALLLLNPSLASEQDLDVAGVHLTSHQLFEFDERPVSRTKLLSASVHNLEELAQANMLQADFVLLSPVLHTSSHPDMEPLGWDRFKLLLDEANCSVFALGGVDESHLAQSKLCGAHGIAAISALWGTAK